jgi:hypothetical protein
MTVTFQNFDGAPPLTPTGELALVALPLTGDWLVYRGCIGELAAHDRSNQWIDRVFFMGRWRYARNASICEETGPNLFDILDELRK